MIVSLNKKAMFFFPGMIVITKSCFPMGLLGGGMNFHTDIVDATISDGIITAREAVKAVRCMYKECLFETGITLW